MDYNQLIGYEYQPTGFEQPQQAYNQPMGYDQSQQMFEQPMSQPVNQGFEQSGIQGYDPSQQIFEQPVEQSVESGFSQPTDTGSDQVDTGFSQPTDTDFEQPVNQDFGQQSDPEPESSATSFEQPQEYQSTGIDPGAGFLQSPSAFEGQPDMGMQTQPDFNSNQGMPFQQPVAQEPTPQSDFGMNQGVPSQPPVDNSAFMQNTQQPINNMGFGGQVQLPQSQSQNPDFYSQNQFGQQNYQSQPTTPPIMVNTPQALSGGQGWPNMPTTPNQQPDNGVFGQPQQSMYEQNINVNTSNWSAANMNQQQAQNSQWSEPVPTQDTVVEMDFSEVTFGQQLQQPSVPTSQVVVDDSLETFAGVGLEDNKVRERETAGGKTRVITKTVVKNISNSNDLVKGMSSGTTRKLLVVTGDRGTGVTSTAFTLALQLSKKVDVLYFDCDIENHGLLNYIDYNKFCGFEDINRNGISLCRSSKAFDSCITMWDDGLTLLTSDFSCDVKEDMLKQVGGIVAERCLDYGLTVVDCPIKFLPCINELLLSANVALCVEGSKRGFMNMLCQLESSPLEMRYKRRMCSSGTMLLTKCVQNTDLKKLINYIISIYEPDGADWMAINKVAFNGKWADKMIAAVLS